LRNSAEPVRGIYRKEVALSAKSAEIGFLSDIRRMNVGMTRARRKLLLVGDSSTLGRHPYFVELLAYVKGVGGYRTVRTADQPHQMNSSGAANNNHPVLE
jgi:hypothetical protein